MRNADMPAMAVRNPDYDGNWDNRRELGGLTKREYLAAKSLPRIEIVTYSSEFDQVEAAKMAAKMALITADALLAELEKTNA